MAEMKSLTLNDKTYDSFVDPVAREWAASSASINSVYGESIAVSDASGGKLYGLSIYGKTTQNGTPTPDAPVELVSVGDGGSIAVTVAGENEERNLTVETPDGLPGIPVTTGGNYTDANGQQWICDEIDLARGVYVKRIHKIISQQMATLGALGTHDNGVPYISVWSQGISNKTAPMSTRYEGWIGSTRSGRCYCTTDGLVVNDMRFIDQSTAKSIMSSEDSVFLCPLATPIETALTAEEIAAYAALRTYRDNTAVSNDASAHMKLEYVMDIKKYIDSRVANAILTATVE